MKKTSTFSLMAVGFCALSLSVNAQLINEGFEGAFPPAGWTVDNPDALTGFTQGTVGKTGSKSALLDIWNSDASGGEQGQMDALITSAINLSSVTGPTFTFYYAYQMYSDPATYTTADALNVYASTDGGANWSNIYSKSGNALVTATPQFDANAGFVATAGDWLMETVDITSVASSSSVQFKIEFTNDWENNFYLDDVVIGGGTSVNEASLDAVVNVFPNPSNGNFNVNLSTTGLGQTDIIVYNMVGEEVQRVSNNLVTPKRVFFNLENEPNGVYFVTVKSESGSTTKKLVVNK